MMKRLMALLLVLVMIVCVCGCSGGGKKKKTDNVQPLPGETPVDLKGYEFTVVDYESDRWNKELSGTPYADAWIQILDEVETLYNCTVTASYKSPADMFNAIQPEIMSGGKYADLIITTEWQYGQLLGADLMMDLNQLDVNWDNEWWNQGVRKTTSFGGRSYVASGSFCFDTAQTWLMYYNEAIWKEHNFEDPYELIESGRWTYDKMRQYCQAVLEDGNQDGRYDSYDDVCGIIAADGDFRDAWFQSMGGKFFEANEDGVVELACNNTHAFEVADRMYNLVQKDKSFSRVEYKNEADRVAHFVDGGALLYAYMPGVSGLQDMEDDWGVMPLPKFDESQEDYISGVDHNAAVFGVTNTNEDLDKVAILLEAFGRHAMILEDIFWPDYKDTYWRHEGVDAAIVSDYVVGHGRHDLALIMQNCNPAFQNVRGHLFKVVFGTAGPTFSSHVQSMEEAINLTIQDYFKYD